MGVGAERANSTEFQIMNSSFNRMIKEIKELKIDNYEKQIERKNAELRHLQAQVNPHFFLNSLNIIFNLATAGEYRLIQDLAKSLANYFRFVFRSSSYFVTLADEIRHTENYLHTFSSCAFQMCLPIMWIWKLIWRNAWCLPSPFSLWWKTPLSTPLRQECPLRLPFQSSAAEKILR